MAILIDLILIALAVAVCVNGYVKGLVISVFNLVSSLVAAVLSFLLYPVLSGILQSIGVLGWIQSPIRDSLLEKGAAAAQISADALLEQLSLPQVFSDHILNTLENTNGALPELAEQISAAAAAFILQVICIVVLFVIIRVALFFVKRVLKIVTKLPILRQLDKLGGVVIGAVEAFVLLMVVGAVFALFSGSVDSGILQAVEDSIVAKFFYQSNWLIALLSNRV